MLLAIDAGNTNTVFAIHDGSRWRAQWRAATYAPRTADEHAVWLSQLMGMEGIDFSMLDGCVVSTVVPQSLFHMRNLARRYLKTEPLVVGEPGVRTGIAIRLDRPEEVGADRLVTAVGARLLVDGAILIVDSGTATTFDVVSADGAFEGGVIAPGYNLSLQALHEAAAKLPRIEIRKPSSVIGKSTVPAMQSGVFWGYAELIDGLVARITEEYGEPMTVLGTGGVASLFEGACRRIDRFEPELTISGLLEIWRRNTPR